MDDHYRILQLNEEYHLDEKQLKASYLKLSKQHHPDFKQADPDEQQKAMLLFSQVNNAYKHLSNPQTRLLHLFHKYELLEPDGQIADQQKLSQEFLMEMMDHNMALEEVLMSEDETGAAEFSRTLETLLAERNQAIDAAMQDFDAADDSDAKDAALKKALPPFFERRYLLRMQEKLANFADPDDD